MLEHRYYGSSQPFQSLTTDDLRYLTEDEALEDSAYVSNSVSELTAVYSQLSGAEGAQHIGRRSQRW